MSDEFYKYTGDRAGTDLERKTYRLVRREIDTVLLEDRDGTQLRVTRAEWDNHLDFGTLERRSHF